MFHKNALPNLDEAPDAHRRFRANVRDLFLTNQISAERASSLLNDAHGAGVETVADVANLQRKGNRNVHRDLLRKFAKKAKAWPKVYWALIDFWNPKKQIIQKEWFALLLPHEWLCAFAHKAGNIHKLARWDGLGPQAQLECIRASKELDVANLIPLAFWCDGVPYNWDRSQSLEVMNLALPGVPEWINLRVPFTAFEHSRIAPGTFDQIFKVLVWSLESLATYIHPFTRHDGDHWKPCDASRKKMAGLHHDEGRLEGI